MRLETRRVLPREPGSSRQRRPTHPHRHDDRAHERRGARATSHGHETQSRTRDTAYRQAVGAAQTRAFRRLALEYGQLMPKGENLHLEIETRPNGGSEGGEQSDEQCSHAGRER